MKKIWCLLKHELQAAIAPFTCFFILFHLLDITKAIMLKSYGLTPTSMTIATVGALIVAKAVLIAEQMPFTHLFVQQHPIVNILWKTFIYGGFTVVFRCIEEIIPLAIKHKGLAVAIQSFFSEVSWPHFWGLQIWLMVGLVFYNCLVYLDHYFGPGSLKKAFWG